MTSALTSWSWADWVMFYYSIAVSTAFSHGTRRNFLTYAATPDKGPFSYYQSGMSAGATNLYRNTTDRGVKTAHFRAFFPGTAGAAANRTLTLSDACFTAVGNGYFYRPTMPATSSHSTLGPMCGNGPYHSFACLVAMAYQECCNANGGRYRPALTTASATLSETMSRTASRHCRWTT